MQYLIFQQYFMEVEIHWHANFLACFIYPSFFLFQLFMSISNLTDQKAQFFTLFTIFSI
jgi:hypothetical protein